MSSIAQSSASAEENVVVVGLTAAIVALEGTTPCALTVEALPGTKEKLHALPSGPFDPKTHRTLESGLREWVEEQTFLALGYVEQLYTFGDRGRHDEALRVLSVGYLALTRPTADPRAKGAHWQSWYAHFPWEDWRGGRPPILDEAIAPALEAWLQAAEAGERTRRRERIGQCFGFYDGLAWDEERVLERYELLYEAGLVQEAVRDRAKKRSAARDVPLGLPMVYDHRRILATAMGRLRGKMKYRPIIFELMPESFTLSELQQAVEAILGSGLHKQNFRRLVENAGLVEETGAFAARGMGRPAQLFRFRREVLSERPAPGVRVAGQKRPARK